MITLKYILLEIQSELPRVLIRRNPRIAKKRLKIGILQNLLQIRGKLRFRRTVTVHRLRQLHCFAINLQTVVRALTIRKTAQLRHASEQVSPQCLVYGDSLLLLGQVATVLGQHLDTDVEFLAVGLVRVVRQTDLGREVFGHRFREGS